ncbi:MAG: RNA polymerase sigma factor [Chloroflexi bacterium]|nr:RNA polymerase sigma factor [Chloroflexota bacterium]
MAKDFGAENFEAIFREHKDMVYRTAYLILGDAHRAEDVLQEVFVRVHKSLDSFDSRKGAFSTWLRRITVNQCITERRNSHSASLSLSLERLEEEGLDPEDTDSERPEELALKREEGQRIQRAMNTLDRKHRAVVTLRYFEQLSYEEIAQVLSIPLGTVKSRLNTAIQALRQELVEGRFRP